MQARYEVIMVIKESHMNKHFHPYVYHGRNIQKKFFEGWYFKHVSLKHDFSFALIPGISKDAYDPHAFVQLIITPMMIIRYFRFDIDAFETVDDPFVVKIANNTFSLNYVMVHLEEDDFVFKADLTYHDQTPIRRSILYPNIMGPFSYLPKMECNHGVLSMDHRVEGTVYFSNQCYAFQDEKGYMEKDWGISFPSRYVWIQCNHFDQVGLSMMGSIATIPYLKTSFEGHIFNIVHQGIEYRFATYNLSSFTIEKMDEHSRKIVLSKGSYRCEIIATIQKTGSLRSPRSGAMNETIKEGLEGTVHLKLWKKDECLIDSIGHHAGVEFTHY